VGALPPTLLFCFHEAVDVFARALPAKLLCVNNQLSMSGSG
jgi:hypothetical protein